MLKWYQANYCKLYNYVIVNLELDSKVCELMHFYILKTGQICSGHEMVGIFFWNFFFASVTFHIACEQQTHFRSSPLSLRKIAILIWRERSDDRKCVCCSQATFHSEWPTKYEPFNILFFIHCWKCNKMIFSAVTQSLSTYFGSFRKIFPIFGEGFM